MRKTTICFFTPNLRFDLKVESELYRGIISATKEMNANLITIIGNVIRNMDEYYSSDNIAYDHIKEDDIDGIIVWGSNLLRNLSIEDQKIFYNKFIKLPIINISHVFSGLPSVISDNADGINQLMTHLYDEHNVRKFAFIAGPENHLYTKHRLEAFKSFCERKDIEISSRNISSFYNFSFQGGSDAIRDLLDYKNLKVGKDVEAIICSSDSMAAGAIIELTSRGVKVPADLYVTGFDNNERAKSSLIPLTTIDSNFYQLGKKAVELLFNQLEGKSIADVTYSEVKLIKRESCGCLEVGGDSIKNGVSDIATITKKETLDITLKKKEKEFLASIEKILGFEKFVVLHNTSLSRLYFNFVDDIFDKSDTFLFNFVLYVNETKSNFQSVYFWQEIISSMRDIVRKELSDNEKILKMETILHQARTQIHRIETHLIEMKNVETREMINTISNISSKILTTFDFGELLDRVEEALADLKISGCYISLYEDNMKPFVKSRLVFGLTKNLLLYKNIEGYLFNTLELIPKDFIKGFELKNIVLLPLCLNKPIGFIVFEVDNPAESHWTIVKDYLSNALHGCMIQEKLKEAYLEKERLLEEFEEKNIELQSIIKEKVEEIEKFKG